MPQETQQALFKRIVKELIKPAFKAEGFTTSKWTFRKQEKGFVKIFDIQQDLRDPKEISFVFNLGFFIHYVHDLGCSYTLSPDKIKESQCCYRTRVNREGNYNAADLWFSLTEKTKFENIKLSVIKAVERSIDLFNHIQTIYDLINFLDKHKVFKNDETTLNLGIGLTLIKLGDKKIGMKLYNQGYLTFTKWLREMKTIDEEEYDGKDDFTEILWKKFKDITRKLKITVKDKIF